MSHIITAPNRIIKPRFEWKPRHIKGHPLSLGLVGHWMLNEPAGLRAHDISGFQNHGTLTNFDFSGSSGWQPGKFGQTLSFDGVNDHVQVSDASSLRIANTITISAWVKLDVIVDNQVIVQKRSLTNHSVDFNYGFWAKSNGDLLFEFYDTAYRDFFSDYGELSAGQWYNVVIVSDEIVDTVKFYKNGKLIKSLANTYMMPSAGTAPVQIGCYTYAGGSPTNYPLDGLIDDVRIYNRALSAQEIMWLYEKPFDDIECQIYRKYWFFSEVAGGRTTFNTAQWNLGNSIGQSLGINR